MTVREEVWQDNGVVNSVEQWGLVRWVRATKVM
jgi:hypothetical protein